MKKFAKGLNNKKILDIFTLCILFLIPIMQMVAYYLEVYNILTDYTSINSAMILWLCIPFLLFIYIKDIFDKKRKLDVYDYIFYFLIFIGIIVTIFAKYPKISLLGSAERRDGLLSLISYYLLFINWKVNGTNSDIKKYIKIFIIIGIINSIYALFQIYSPFNFILRFDYKNNMAIGFCGNPNFFGSLITVLLAIMTVKFLSEDRMIKKDIIILILFFVSLINCQSTVPVLTYFVTSIFMILFLSRKKKLFCEKIVVLVLIILFSIISAYTFLQIKNNYHNENDKLMCDTCDIKGIVNSGGSGRLKIWENTIKIIPQNFITGVGYDNLEYAYPNPEVGIKFYFTNDHLVQKEEEIKIVDNAHNVYLHNLAVSGILGLIPYLVLCLYTFVHGLKSNNKLIFMLLGGFTAYSIQAFFNIDVIEVVPIYYIIIGLILSEKKNKDKTLT